jgi:hypothetical protein
MSDPIVPITPPETTVTEPAQNQGKTFTQAEVDAILKERLDRKEKQAADAAAKLKADAEAAAAIKNGEWQKLAESRAAELTAAQAKAAEAESAKAQREAMEAALKTNVEAQLKAYDANTQDLIKRLPVLDQLDWITKHPAQAGAVETKTPAGPGALPGETQGKPKTMDELIKAKRADYGSI